jgi:hypothetical protein
MYLASTSPVAVFTRRAALRRSISSASIGDRYQQRLQLVPFSIFMDLRAGLVRCVDARKGFVAERSIQLSEGRYRFRGTTAY